MNTLSNSGHARLRQHRQREVAQVAVVALVQDAVAHAGSVGRCGIGAGGIE